MISVLLAAIEDDDDKAFMLNLYFHREELETLSDTVLRLPDREK